MQLRYLGDVTDHAKYALLRRLIGVHDRGRRLRLGINWYLTDPAIVDAPDNNDGHKRDIAPDLVALDPELAQQLAGFREPTARSFDRLRASGIFPEDTTYHEEPVSMPEQRALRQRARAAWHGRALHALEAADLVLVDPDNGLLLRTEGMQSDWAPKYALAHEVRAFTESARSVVLVHFADRRFDQADVAREIGKALGASEPIAFSFRGALLIVLAARPHQALLKRRADAIADGSLKRVL